ncbi:G8 domain-containing protein [Bdellovibrio bacteriovorus]|uniref:Uncharacterized protein n=1 Tax=Bdellovibrio bacteriovorus str. Tiberius TaxID=1069642 RepID=K7YZF5_BDEBC|nr:G8 domain-containing protein [Bdellovibrio bacteriovorus]AFY02100.1 hypothetical protein Bdt_2417 [Bdellovibrio bacteriovorus str. Tiberius]
MKIFKTSLILTTLSVSSAAADVTGYIDTVKELEDGTVSIRGWACDSAVSSTINVHLYAGAPAGNKDTQFVTSTAANLASESQVSSACQTQKVSHRFEARLPRATALKYSSQPLYAYGISLSKKANLQLAQSGKHSIPSRREIAGQIDSVQERTSDGAVVIRGWACDRFNDKSISVHLYANAAAGGASAIFVKSALTGKSSESAIKTICGTKASGHRFESVIPKGVALRFAGSPVFAHGISTSGGANSLIGNAGRFSIPNYPADQKLSQLMLNADGSSISGDFVIPAGFRVEMDRNINVRNLTIQGRLFCPAKGHFTLKASSLHVHGSEALLQCGTSMTPFQGQLKIAIKGGVFLKDNCDGALVPCSDRNIMAMKGGTIRLIGNKANSKWLKLNKTAEPGSAEIVLTEAVQWKAGDRIAIAPTAYRYLEAEEAVIKSVQGTRVILTAPLKYRHNGQSHSYKTPTKTWVVDERAEVANLTRNIHITSDGNTEAMNFKGAHLMIMPSSYGYIDGVEFSHMGRMGEMARYPFHWHRVGDAAGQYIKNSSIHHSFQRCITVHATNNALVENNVCYDHYGHGFFLEDGNEVGNTFAKNLGILSRRPLPDRHILQSDIDVSSPGRFPGPATFWVSNPNNIFKDNVAAGSQGTGYWMSFARGVSCEKFNCSFPDSRKPANVFPRLEVTRQFDNNTARTTTVGFTWDGVADGALTENPRNPHDRKIVTVHYAPAKTPTIRNMKAFKSVEAAMYTRAQTMNFVNALFADNRSNIWAAYNLVMRDSAVIAISGNHQPAEFKDNSHFTGARIYDGPMDLSGIDFINFNDVSYGSTVIKPTPFRSVGASERFANVAQKLRFFPEPSRKIVFDAVSGPTSLGGTESASIRDLDGSLTGTPQSLLVPTHAFNNAPGCAAPTDESVRAMLCNYEVGSLYLFNPNKATTAFGTSRSDGVKLTTNNFMNKVNLIYGGKYEYNIHYNEELDLERITVVFKTANQGALSPVVAIRDLPGRHCKMSQGRSVASLSELRNAQDSAYYSAPDVLYIKNKATGKAGYVTGTSNAQIGQGVMGKILCQ